MIFGSILEMLGGVTKVAVYRWVNNMRGNHGDLQSKVRSALVNRLKEHAMKRLVLHHSGI